MREAISYDFLMVADDRQGRDSGIHVVVLTLKGALN